jgi:hypothetical protein
MLRALSLALVLTGSALLAPPLAVTAQAEDASGSGSVIAQEAPPAPPPAARKHQCERQQDGVS